MADLFCIGAPQTSEASICTLINYKQRIRRKIDTYLGMVHVANSMDRNRLIKSRSGKLNKHSLLWELCTETNNCPTLTSPEKNRAQWWICYLWPWAIKERPDHIQDVLLKKKRMQSFRKIPEVYYYFSVWCIVG